MAAPYFSHLILTSEVVAWPGSEVMAYLLFRQYISGSERFLTVPVHFLMQKHMHVRLYVLCAYMLYFLTDCVFVNRREDGGDKRRTEAAHN